MRQTVGRLIIVLIGVSTCLSACITSKLKPIAQVSSGLQADTASIRIFLLEREIPQDIEALGVVSISINSRPNLNIDQLVKQQLQKDCQRVGANGAYRINDGTYFPTVVSYLVFKYKK